MNVLKFLSFVVSLYTLAASVAGAATFEPWTYKGKISWKHPSGKNIVGRFVETSVDDDILRIIREAGTGEYFAEMQLIGNGSHLSEPAHFFVLDAPKIAGAVKLAKVAASVWPNPGGSGGSIVAELPPAHLDAWKAGSGNLMGATYIFGNSSSLSNFKTYYFSGKNFGDALRLGYACDEAKFFWWEDPYMDGGMSQFAHRKLRQMVKTPLLQTEHIRLLEQHVDLVLPSGVKSQILFLKWLMA